MSALTKVLLLVFGIAVLVGCTTQKPVNDVALHYPYTNSLSSAGAQFGALPPVVQRTIRAQAGAAQIQQITPLRISGGDIYEVSFSHYGLVPLYVAHDGSVLYPDFTVAVPVSEPPTGVPSRLQSSNVPITDLPKATHDQLIRLAPTTPISNINREVWGNREVYIINFTPESNTPSLYITSDGSVLTAPSHVVP